MTKEEYQINLIRMWDSVRSTHKGQKDCIGVNCKDCPFDRNFCNMYDAIEVVENWIREHPVITNAMKFKEVFGIEPDKRSCVNGNVINCRDCEYHGDAECAVSKLFWNAEYKKTKGADNERND